MTHVHPSSLALQLLSWKLANLQKWWQVTVWQIFTCIETLKVQARTARHALILKGRLCRLTPQELLSDGHQCRSLNLRPEGEGRLPCLSSMPQCVSVSLALRSLPESTSRASRPDEYFRCRVTLSWQACVFFSVAVAAQTRPSRRCRNDASRKFGTDELICQRAMNTDGTQSDKVGFKACEPNTLMCSVQWFLFWITRLIFCCGCQSLDFLQSKVSFPSPFLFFYFYSVDCLSCKHTAILSFHTCLGFNLNPNQTLYKNSSVLGSYWSLSS